MGNKINVAVTGAAGQIGYALLFRIASGQMFGPTIEVHLSLLELPNALPALKGVIMELEDCAFPLLGSVRATADPAQAFEGAEWALLVGSVPRKAGMERADLLKINGGVFIEQGKALEKSAQENCRVLVVGNPCNTNAWIAKSVARRLSPKNFFAMTLLDQHRAKAQLARKAGCSVTDVENVIIWGNHSATQFPDFFHATIKGQQALEMIQDEEWLKNEFIQNVQQRGAAIIKARGSSSAASAANAIVDTVKAVHSHENSKRAFSVAVCSDGSYGVEEGLMFSFPVVCEGNSWKIAQGIEHNSFSEEKIRITQKELVAERKAVSDLIT